ncbi:MAG: hypothetical protein CMM90_02565 [Rickettsiales bacterium]|nr:hypothetical protein [Rickettsiales bacterium]
MAKKKETSVIPKFFGPLECELAILSIFSCWADGDLTQDELNFMVNHGVNSKDRMRFTPLADPTDKKLSIKEIILSSLEIIKSLRDEADKDGEDVKKIEENILGEFTQALKVLRDEEEKKLSKDKKINDEDKSEAKLKVFEKVLTQLNELDENVSDREKKLLSTFREKAALYAFGPWTWFWIIAMGTGLYQCTIGF